MVAIGSMTHGIKSGDGETITPMIKHVTIGLAHPTFPGNHIEVAFVEGKDEGSILSVTDDADSTYVKHRENRIATYVQKPVSTVTATVDYYGEVQLEVVEWPIEKRWDDEN